MVDDVALNNVVKEDTDTLRNARCLYWPRETRLTAEGRFDKLAMLRMYDVNARGSPRLRADPNDAQPRDRSP
jgi:hypothetical protein